MARFLTLPDALDVSSQIYYASTFLGAFPFLNRSPAILTYEAMLRVISIFTGRYSAVMKGEYDSAELIFRSISQYDRGVGVKPGFDEQDAKVSSFQIRKNSKKDEEKLVSEDKDVENEEDDEDDENDEMVFAAFEALDSIEAFKHTEKPKINVVRKISVEDMVKLVMFLLVTAPLNPQESLALYAERYSSEAIAALRQTAENIVRSMSIDGRPIQFRDFERSAKGSLVSAIIQSSSCITTIY